MGIFTDAEIEYLTSARRLARVATVGADGMPHVTPVGMVSYDTDSGVIEITGRNFESTKKFRDVRRTGKAALVVDDVVERPWQPRAIEVRGDAEAIFAPESKIRLRPRRIVAWGLDDATEPNARSVSPSAP